MPVTACRGARGEREVAGAAVEVEHALARAEGAQLEHGRDSRRFASGFTCVKASAGTSTASPGSSSTRTLGSPATCRAPAPVSTVPRTAAARASSASLAAWSAGPGRAAATAESTTPPGAALTVTRWTGARSAAIHARAAPR
jgi:hypothetical protein